MSGPVGKPGRVLQLNRKSPTPGQRGLPKLPVADARLTAEGVEGDFNVYRHEVKQDDPRMAVLLMPFETIHQLGQEGWPVRPGDLGENITSVGVPYHEFAPGLRFRVGGALLEITKACTPCENLFALPYVGEKRGPAFLRATLGRRGWYARVVEPGVVRTGDPIARVTTGGGE